MQLSEAIDGWLAAHSAGLSGSTRRDIADIAASADRCGYAWIDCVDVRERHLNEIVADADASSSLNASAIGQFLEIAVEWAITQTETAGIEDDLLPSDTDGWLDAKAPPVVDDLDLDAISWVDDLPPVDDLDVDNDGELDPLDQDQFFDLDEIEEPEPAAETEPEQAQPQQAEPVAEEEEEEEEEEAASAEAEPAEEAEPDPDEDLVDEDDFDDDELAAIDEDLTATDEDDLDDDELDGIDGDLATLLDDREDDRAEDPEDAEDDGAETADDLFFVDDEDDLFDGADDVDDEPSPTASAFSAAAASGAPSDPAASSFLRTLEQTGQTPAVFGGAAAQPGTPDLDISAASKPDAHGLSNEQAGIFSEAAQYDGERSIDWITVAYFAVAAICFALVIYFYLSS